MARYTTKKTRPDSIMKLWPALKRLNANQSLLGTPLRVAPELIVRSFVIEPLRDESGLLRASFFENVCVV
jgi:hypothetical protein